jgi:hypothetical protein
MKPERNYNVIEVDGTIFLENHREGSYPIGEIGFVEPMEFVSMHQGITIRNLLNKNWEQFNEQKCWIQRLTKQNKELHKINGKLHRKIHDYMNTIKLYEKKD